MTSAPLRITSRRARRLAVMGQLLSAPMPRSIEEVVRGLGMVQMDPTSAVARTEHLVFWSRLGGRFRIAELERMLWQERSLFEYWAHILPTSDLAIHREVMRRSARGDSGRDTLNEWLRANASFRRYVLTELRRRGPLRTRELEDRAAQGWRPGGWNNDQKSTGLLLEALWDRGEVMIVGRDGQQRLWDLAERRLPVDEPRRPQAEIARRILEGRLRAWGVARPGQFARTFDGRPPGWERALSTLVREGVAVPVAIDGLDGEWYTHSDLIDRTFRPRTTLLSPFDDLISDRDHTEELFDYFFRLEIYTPKAKRRYGYFVMPILRGDRLIGRIDPRLDRSTAVLHVNAVYAEPGAPASAGPALRRSIDGLATWLGASEVRYTRRMPAIWRRALTS